MKLLVAVQFCFPSGDHDLVFLYAWRRFIQQHRNELDCDFVFMNNGLDIEQFNFHAQDIKTAQVLYYPGRVAWDTDSSYYPFKLFHGQYDFIMRIDCDAFPSVANLQSCIDFLKANPATDFVSATNFCRPITNSADSRTMILDTSGVQLHECPNWSWDPWGYPTHNSDMYIMRSEFFRRCIDAYNLCQYVTDPPFPHTPFNQAQMTYAQVCDVLHYQEGRFPSECMNWKLRIDGSINTDFWTVMCSLKPNMVGVVNHDGHSFRIKNHVLNYGPALAQNVPFSQLTDSCNVAFPHSQNIVAPYFHMGNAYVSESFFHAQGAHLNHPNTVGQFQAASATFVIAHYCIVLLLARSSGHEGILGRLEGCMKPYFQRNAIDYNAILSHLDNIDMLYAEPLESYLDRDNIRKYNHVLKAI